MSSSPRFWEQKSLTAMTDAEWESLCDGCGKCCLHKLEDEDSGEVFYTCVACAQLDTERGGCRNYSRRLQLVPDCIDLRPLDLAALHWLPSTCAYRLVYEQKPLPPWHPLISGSRQSVHEAGISVMGRVYAESEVAVDDLEDYIVHWVE
ncbi:MAG: YcgN family cysteine cluster protein [Gammaproteobacteria bacterium]|nr:YcgN family cysteine cluster protein [Gammaproteobacteria bacterium]